MSNLSPRTASGFGSKKWLEQNKIFFEIPVTLFLMAMAVLVSFSQCSLEKKQTDLINKQTELAKIQLKPRIEFDFVKLLSNDQYLEYKKDKGVFIYRLKLENEGASLARGFKYSVSYYSGNDFNEGCSNIDSRNLKFMNFPFPQNIKPGFKLTLDFTENIKNQNPKLVTDLENSRSIGIKIVVNYYAEGFPNDKKETQLFYVLHNNAAILACRSEN